MDGWDLQNIESLSDPLAITADLHKVVLLLQRCLFLQTASLIASVPDSV